MHSFDLRKRFRRRLRREAGQTMVEYGVVLTVVSVGAVFAFGELARVAAASIDRVVGLVP